MYGYVYKTTCLITGLIYVGKHKAQQFEPNKYMGSGSIITKLFKQFGKDNFVCELLEAAETKEDLVKLEEYWIAKLHAQDPAVGYNIMKSGNFSMSDFRKMVHGNETRWVNNEQIVNYLRLGWTFPNAAEVHKHTNAQWYLKNKEKQKIKNKKYKTEHAKELSEKKKIYNAEHKEHNKDLWNVWYDKNKEKRKLQRHNKYLEKKSLQK